MNFTDKDKMLARKYREAGYEWVVRGRKSLGICKEKPKKLWVFNIYVWITDDSCKRVDKRNFKPVQFSDSEPTRLDDIIGD